MNSVRSAFGSIRHAFKRKGLPGQTGAGNAHLAGERVARNTNTRYEYTSTAAQTDSTGDENPVYPMPRSSANSDAPPISDRQFSIDEYKMPPTAEMAERVAQHHKYLYEITRFLIHPRIQREIPPDARIADLNTGTGAFLLHLSGEMTKKQYTLIGFDTIPQIFPATYPSNVSFKYHHILAPHPPQRHDSFDSVHTSLLGPVLVSDDWDRVFNNMMDLVKPGGWIQWIDVNLSSRDNKDRIYVSKAGSSKKAYEEMMEGIEVLDAHYNNKTSGGKRLKEIARAHPEVDVATVTEEVFNTAQLNNMRINVDILTVQAWKRLLKQIPSKYTWDPDRVERVAEAMEKEARDGVYIPMEVYVVIARKKRADILQRERGQRQMATKIEAAQEAYTARERAQAAPEPLPPLPPMSPIDSWSDLDDA